MRFKEFIRLVEALDVKDWASIIVQALDGNEEDIDFNAKLTLFKPAHKILDSLRMDHRLQTAMQNNPAAISALQAAIESDSNLTVGQLSSILAR